MTTRAQLSHALLLALAPLAACGRTEDEITDWKLLAKGGASGTGGKAGAGGGTAGAAQTGGKAGAAAGSAGATPTAGSAGGTPTAGAGGATLFACIPGVATPMGFPTVKRCFEPFEGGCPEIGLGIVKPDLPELCGITCQIGGPVPAEPGDPGKCCYLVEEVCEGRPLFVGARLVTARVVRSARWT